MTNILSKRMIIAIAIHVVTLNNAYDVHVKVSLCKNT